MTFLKRMQDLVSLTIIGTVLLPVALVIVLLVLLRDGRPIFYISERMHSPTRAFGLIKFRTMTAVDQKDTASGGDKSDRITPLGRKLRALRLDEIPQLLNVLRGDISFVGPRPPLRQFVEDYPEIYGEVLQSRPGITGVASIYYHKHEEKLLAHCQTPEETEAIYRRRCIPAKARLDLIYQRNRTVCWDIWLMFRTIV